MLDGFFFGGIFTGMSIRSGSISLKKALSAAVGTARSAGALMRKNLHEEKQKNEVSRHDIKLELDVRCQALIESGLRKAFPGIAVVGEEGITGDTEADYRWVVDPIDGTVNFSYGIPHAAVSIALQKRTGLQPASPFVYHDGYATVAGVVYDPFCDELWTGIEGGKALLNGREIRVSSHSSLRDSIISVGFSKTAKNIAKMMPYMFTLSQRVRKVRIMGSAALALVYVASGRFDGYVEPGLRLWDIAAGGFITELAGGEFYRVPNRLEYSYQVTCTNGLVRRKLRVPA